MIHSLRNTICLACFFLAGVPWCAADDLSQQDLEQVVARAIRYLRTSGVTENGSYGGDSEIGVTALATTALLKHGVKPDDPVVEKSLRYLQSHVKPDGGIYGTGSALRNYETCLTMICFKEANTDGRYDKVIARADAFVKGFQWGADEGADESDLSYGGAGYGKHKRPDMSNTSFFVDALAASGNGADSEAIATCVGLHITLPELGDVAQYDPLCNQGERWWLLLHGRRRR